MAEDNNISGETIYFVCNDQQYLNEVKLENQEPVTEVNHSEVLIEKFSEEPNEVVTETVNPKVEPVPETSKAAENDCLNIQQRRFRCPECQRYTAETDEKLLRHIRKVHRGENPFQCYMCDYSTYNKTLFEEHVRIHQGIKPFVCSHCPYRSVSKKNLKKHEQRHRPDNPLKCSSCDFIAYHQRSLKRHEDAEHRVQHSVNYKCRYCSFTTNDYKQFNAHRKTHVYKCQECDFSSISKSALTHHKVKKHARNSFKCQLCDWFSDNKPRILLHLIHHPNQTVDENLVDLTILRQYDIIK